MSGTKIAIWTTVFVAAAMEYACAAPMASGSAMVTMRVVGPPGILTMAALTTPTPPPGTVFPFYLYGSPYYNPVQYYIVAEKRGTDVVWASYSLGPEVATKVMQLRAEARATVQTNVVARKQLGLLKNQAYQLRSLAAQQTDPDKKQVLLTRLNEVQQTITATGSEIRPVVQWVVAGPLSWRDMENFLSRLTLESGPENVHRAGTPRPVAGY